MPCPIEPGGSASGRGEPALLPGRQFTRESDEVYLASGDPVAVDAELIAFIKEKALASPLGRARLCCHGGAEAPLHEMLIALAGESYLRPHRHREKSESFHVIAGSADLVLFEPDGRVASAVSLGDIASGLPFYYRISAPRYHALLVRSDIFIFHETTNGPFRREATEYAPWSPGADKTVAVAQFLSGLKKTVAQHKRRAA
jgi:cupin fold WbuC family metalloprotein